MASAHNVGETAADLSPEDATRAGVYRLLGGYLSRPPTWAHLEMGATLLGDASPLGQLFDRFAAACRATTPERAADEYQTLFVGLGRGEIVPYASYYLTGFLQEKPLARLRTDMGQLGIVRAEDTAEPEDHAASVLEMMAGLIDGSFGPQLTLPAQKIFFDAHIGSWMGHLFRDLERNDTSVFYAALGAIGASFLAIEEEAFQMT